MTAFNRLLIFVLVIVASAAAIAGQTPCSRYSNAVSGFSVCLPADWTKSDIAGEALPRFYAAAPNAGEANLNFVLTEITIPLADFVTSGNKYVLSHVKEIGAESISLLSRTEFQTASKEKGILLIYSVVVKGKNLITNQFCFDLNQSQKIVLTFTHQESYKEVNDEFFNSVASTFQLEK